MPEISTGHHLKAPVKEEGAIVSACTQIGWPAAFAIVGVMASIAAMAWAFMWGLTHE